MLPPSYHPPLGSVYLALFATKVVIMLNYNQKLFSAIQDRLMDMAFKIEFKNVADRLELNLKSTLLVILNRTKQNVLLIVLLFRKVKISSLETPFL